MTQAILIKGGNDEIADVDAVSKGVILIDTVHARIHAGMLFAADLVDVALAGAASLEMLVRTAVGMPVHMRISTNAGGDARIRLFEAPTTTADGTPLALKDRNRITNNTATALVFSAPTVTVDGTSLLDAVQPASKGASFEAFGEFVLAANTDYLVRVTNLAGGAQAVSLQADMYESGGG